MTKKTTTLTIDFTQEEYDFLASVAEDAGMAPKDMVVFLIREIIEGYNSDHFVDANGMINER